MGLSISGQTQRKPHTTNLGPVACFLSYKRRYTNISEGFSLAVTPAEGLQDKSPPAFFTHDIHQLRSLVTECKRLKEISGNRQEFWPASADLCCQTWMRTPSLILHSLQHISVGSNRTSSSRLHSRVVSLPPTTLNQASRLIMA
jgi:hypothetical protein